MNLKNTPIESLLAYSNTIRYFLKHKVIWFYDRIDILGTEALCASNEFPEYKIKGLGRIIYFDRNRKQIGHKYYEY